VFSSWGARGGGAVKMSGPGEDAGTAVATVAEIGVAASVATAAAELAIRAHPLASASAARTGLMSASGGGRVAVGGSPSGLPVTELTHDFADRQAIDTCRCVIRPRVRHRR
jgi:hypothetical protein